MGLKIGGGRGHTRCQHPRLLPRMRALELYACGLPHIDQQPHPAQTPGLLFCYLSGNSCLHECAQFARPLML